jgi:hypothetical protein
MREFRDILAYTLGGILHLLIMLELSWIYR